MARAQSELAVMAAELAALRKSASGPSTDQARASENPPAGGFFWPTPLARLAEVPIIGSLCLDANPVTIVASRSTRHPCW
jgi:hypothetical protein